MADVTAEKTSTLVMPFPVELLRFFEHATSADTPTRATAPPALTDQTDADIARDPSMDRTASETDEAGVLPDPGSPDRAPATPLSDPRPPQPAIETEEP